MLHAIDRLFKHEASGGVLLMLSAIAAMLIANSAFAPSYEFILNTEGAITMNGKGIEKPMFLWINDGLMAVFFFLVGLELKRELLEGKLKNPRNVILPGAAAIGGMAIPAAFYAFLNWGDPASLKGWAIPAATDIAFALGILALVGSRAPASLKVFLLTLAILDDIGAIMIIALFYTAELKTHFLVMAAAPFVLMFVLNLMKIHRVGPFLILGTIIWVLVLKSGVHATLAGVITALFIPLRDRYGSSPLHSMEHALMPYVNFFILPVFAFANAGVILAGLSFGDLLDPVPLGIALGLVLGKQIGVFGMTYLIVKSGFARLPHGTNWLHIYGVACLAGIGFTMSLFIGGLSFVGPELMNQTRLGVLAGSLISGVIGFVVLFLAGNPSEERSEQVNAPKVEPEAA